MGFTDVLRKAFPFISAAASLGGPLGTMAANVVGNALGMSKPPAGTADGISNAIALAMADPAQRAAILKAEQDFQVQMAQLGYQHAEELEAIAQKDRESARNREIQVRDWTPRLLTWAFMLMAGYIVWAIMHGHAEVLKDPTTSLTVGAVIGYIFSDVKEIVSYYFGSSAGSAAKDKALTDLAKGP